MEQDDILPRIQGAGPTIKRTASSMSVIKVGTFGKQKRDYGRRSQQGKITCNQNMRLACHRNTTIMKRSMEQ
ncbi:hypothetical protein B9Z55_028150 [Caenorhabditis nigoni]|uniref:Uncharacterized protein n=1 Tax=Caenorhabditis nigoni TaxID=1611254 RepID=A0A2G5SD30_9PELO|nr:hypothetical protein B9Z55_028150 [Caenorhabditis nigoni]